MAGEMSLRFNSFANATTCDQCSAACEGVILHWSVRLGSLKPSRYLVLGCSCTYWRILSVLYELFQHIGQKSMLLVSNQSAAVAFWELPQLYDQEIAGERIGKSSIILKSNDTPRLALFCMVEGWSSVGALVLHAIKKRANTQMICRLVWCSMV